MRPLSIRGEVGLDERAHCLRTLCLIYSTHWDLCYTLACVVHWLALSPLLRERAQMSSDNIPGEPSERVA